MELSCWAKVCGSVKGRQRSRCRSLRLRALVCSFSISTVKLEGNQPHCRSRILSPSYHPTVAQRRQQWYGHPMHPKQITHRRPSCETLWPRLRTWGLVHPAAVPRSHTQLELGGSLLLQGKKDTEFNCRNVPFHTKITDPNARRFFRPLSPFLSGGVWVLPATWSVPCCGRKNGQY